MTADEDVVNHPKHYLGHPSGVECIQVKELLPSSFGDALKYLWRAGSKGHQAEDLRKASWYLRREACRAARGEMSADRRVTFTARPRSRDTIDLEELLCAVITADPDSLLADLCRILNVLNGYLQNRNGGAAKHLNFVRQSQICELADRCEEEARRLDREWAAANSVEP